MVHVDSKGLYTHRHHHLEAIVFALQSKKTITHCWSTNLFYPCQEALNYFTLFGPPPLYEINVSLMMHHFVSFHIPSITNNNDFFVFFQSPFFFQLILFFWLIDYHKHLSRMRGLGTGIYCTDSLIRSFLYLLKKIVRKSKYYYFILKSERNVSP